MNLAPWTGEVHLRLIAPSSRHPYGGRRVVGRFAPILPLRCGPADDEDVVRLTIVRHARAGTKRAWDGDDALRPLDELGRVQAAALAPRLAGAGPVRRLISSPALRCVQTLQPLADVVGLPIERWDALGPHAGAAGVRSTLGHPAFDDVVLCTHGEVLRPLLRTLRRRGVGRDGAQLHGRLLLVKGSAWLVSIAPDGTVSSFEHLTPH
jgi:phosphohistidine phosphatase SixA